ncbi:hypothetical protein C8A03DRAFT_15242 [Achaetomium macrosporum]|uniref:Glucan 1, 4-alpha-glucosidase n=1 Tax=Achaetomium macrosporum TaxID=79813 RepID=A0AAN7CA76_9PEZI|nr:hypothetical protein C8A03DRAFT_15242 [Achaetomium macrosporum]
MDDPWGSPWASTDSDKDKKPASPAGLDIAPPPRAFLSASSSPRIPAVLEQSPWRGDDDGFGEWATASDIAPAHAVWAGGWGASSPNLPSTPREEFLSKTSPIAWPENVATPKPANGAAFRQPSPDPWASGFSSRRASNDGISTPRLVVDAPSPMGKPTDALPTASLERGVSETHKGLADELNTDDSKKDVTATKPGPVPDDTAHIGASTASSGSHVREGVESAAQSREYQSSTHSNDNTDREDERQDSPIISIEEEPRAQRPVFRKTSGKVQELVVKFDGLARALSEERIPVPERRSRSPLSGRGDDSDAGADFGDFEDADENESSLRPNKITAETVGDAPDVINASAALQFPATDTPARVASPIAKFGPLDFRVDLDLAAKLFPPLPRLSTHDVRADHELSDHIISDSFTEISERKTWYRISRLGSSRRHNSGDDESYRRVAWPTSTVHCDTIKIVRRWMEEDSIAGRVALGGGVSKTQRNMFGWDSSAEPVALDAVFGRRKSHSRASSLQSFQTSGPPRPAVPSGTKKPLQGPTHRPSGSVGPAVASFGWSGGSPASTKPARPTSMPPNTFAVPLKPPASRPQVFQLSGPTPFPKQPVDTAIPGPPLAPASGSNEAAAAEDADDDEWGEMVSSPVVPQPVANGSEILRPATPPMSTASEGQINVAVDSKPSSGPIPDHGWAAADLSVFESAPAKTAPHVETPIVVAEPVEPSAPALRAGNPTVLPSSTPSSTKTSNTQEQHDEAAQRIISNLPDLSYMLR